ncbi:VanZ family protein [Alkaliphilus crotonatoxidans]
MKKKHAWMIIILVVGLLFFLSSIPGLRVLPLVRQINHLLRSYDLSITRLSQWIAQRLPMHTNELRPLETISQDFYRYARANPVIIEFILRKLAHVFIFFMVTVSLFLLLHQYVNRSYRAVLLAAAGASLLAVIDEYRQTFVPGRHGSRIDVLIDMVGVVIAVFFIGLSFLITRWGLPQGTKVSSTKD